MEVHDVRQAMAEVRRKAAADPRRPGRVDFGSFDDGRVGLGRYSGRSPWERHLNGDELLYVLDGKVEITLLTDSLEAERETLRAGDLFVVPKGRWHQLDDKSGGVSVFFVSPPDEGAERTRDDPRG